MKQYKRYRTINETIKKVIKRSFLSFYINFGHLYWYKKEIFNFYLYYISSKNFIRNSLYLARLYVTSNYPLKIIHLFNLVNTFYYLFPHISTSPDSLDFHMKSRHKKALQSLHQNKCNGQTHKNVFV